MAPVYSVELLNVRVTPSGSAVVILPPPYTYVLRSITCDISNGFPDTGGGFVTVTLGTINVVRHTFPGAFLRTVTTQCRIVAPGGADLGAACGGGGSLGVYVLVTGYRLTP